MNSLSQEHSPYLLQHANNPVNWRPWGEEALQQAKAENKPILLSIGYAACHWCHVMAHESFEDQETAELMNQWFINIKVDREERPDLDKIYQLAHQLLTGQPGGWPLTIFLTPDLQLPFFSGTYFPKAQSYGRPAFKTLLSQVAHFYYQRKDAIENLSTTLNEAFTQINSTSPSASPLDNTPLLKARVGLERNFDFVHGGFGREPKFPMTLQLENLLQYFYDSRHQDVDALKMVENSLTRMIQGGLFDQIGGGFFRYCVDASWLIPHFEKMLYDNAQLLMLYSQGALITGNNLYRQTAFATYHWLTHEMLDVNGGFYSSLNADSEGEEGKYYVWDRQEIAQSLTSREYYVIETVWGLKKPPNFEGKWHLHMAESPDPVEFETIKQIKHKLLSIRQHRVPPSKDTKILTAWNALMVKSLLIMGQVFEQNEIVVQAKATLDFINHNLWKNKRLFAAYANGIAYLPGYLDDYAFLLDALLHYLQVNWDENYFNWMMEIAEQLYTYFYDQEHGGFFYTAHDHENLIFRPKTLNDEALPSGNGVAALCFLRLGNLLGEAKYLQAAEKTLQNAAEILQQQPSGYNSLLKALREYLGSPTIIILRGKREDLATWQKIFFQRYLPHHLCFALFDGAKVPEVLQKPTPEQGVLAYFCQGQNCKAPISNLEEFNIL